jgi:hypothetical protein
MLIDCFSRVDPLDDGSFQTLQQGLFNYIQSEYVYGPAEANATCTCRSRRSILTTNTRPS